RASSRVADGQDGGVTPPSMPPIVPDSETIAELRTMAERLARAAGALVREGRPGRVDVSATKSSPVDVVTAMDLAAEDLLRRTIAEHRPDDGILGEEDGLVAGTSGVTW